MKSARRRGNSRQKNVEPITVWQTLNEPVVEVSEEFAKGVFMFAAAVLLAVWMAPYWGSADQYQVSSIRYQGAAAGAISYNVPQPPLNLRGGEGELLTTIPSWYYIASAIPGDVAGAFAAAATAVLDISEPVSQIAEFYEPGVDAVWNAWLDLMADPY